jgi:hypothetical protein
MPTGSVRYHATFTVHRNLKASPSAICVYAANAACMSIELFHKDRIFLKDITLLIELFCFSYVFFLRTFVCSLFCNYL